MKRLAPLTALALVACWLLAAHASASVYWSNYSTGKIGRADSSGQNQDQAILSTPHPWGVAVDGQHLYWTTRDNLIGRANLSGDNADPNFVSGASSPFGIAVTDQYAVWANNGTSSIGLSNLELGSPNPSFLGAGSPIGVAADSQHIYWTNSADNSVARADLGGGNANLDFITGASQPAGMAVDAQHIYWVNYDTSTIGRADLDGSHVDQSFITATSMPEGVAVDGQHIWWTNLGSNTIGRANLNGTDATQYGIANASAPEGVAATPLATGTGHASADTLYFTASGTHTLRIQNDGTGNLQLDSARLEGANTGDFSLAGDGCSLKTIAPGDACKLDIHFEPGATGNRLAALTFSDNDTAPVTVGLTGTTQPPVSRADGPSPGPTPATPQSAIRKSVVECGLNRAHTKATCGLRLGSAASNQVHWRLVRSGRVYRRGVVNVNGGSAKFKLGPLPKGRYLLHVDGVEQVIQITVRRTHR